MSHILTTPNRDEDFAKTSTRTRRPKRRVITLVLAGLAVGGIGAAAVANHGTGSSASSAWLSVTSTLTGGTFATGNVAVTTTKDGAAAYVPFNASNIAPGSYAYEPLTVTATGTLGLRYGLTATPTVLSAATSGPPITTDGVELAKELTFAAKTGLTPAQCAAETGAGDATWIGGTTVTPATAGALATSTPAVGSTVNVIGDPATGQQTGDRALPSGASETLCLQVALPSTSGNQVAGASFGFTFAVNAEQTLGN